MKLIPEDIDNIIDLFQSYADEYNLITMYHISDLDIIVNKPDSIIYHYDVFKYEYMILINLIYNKMNISRIKKIINLYDTRLKYFGYYICEFNVPKSIVDYDSYYNGIEYQSLFVSKKNEI